MAASLSRLDIRLLTEIQKDASLSTAELAERIGLSQSSCWRRYQRLMDEGYIKARVALVDPEKVGVWAFVFLNLKVGSLEQARRDELMRLVEITPEIMECHWTFGEMEMMLKIAAPDMDWYKDFLFRRIRGIDGIKETGSTVVLATAKHSPFIPILTKPSD